MSQIVNCYSLLLLSQLQQTERVVERQARLWPDNEKLEPDESKQEGEENADVVQVGTVGGSTTGSVSPEAQAEWQSFAKTFFSTYSKQCRQVLDIVEHYRISTTEPFSTNGKEGGDEAEDMAEQKLLEMMSEQRNHLRGLAGAQWPE